MGDSLLMVSPAGTRVTFPAFLYVYVEDADAQGALDAGAVSLEAVWDTPYGDRRGMVRDPWGNVWQIATHMLRWAPCRRRSRQQVAQASGDVREVIKMLEKEGWRLVVTRGSHRQFKHPTRPGRVTVSGHPGDEMPKGTLASVRRQAGLEREKR
jgi:predicted RNA binding protein YcfA (HicA-like mRNA interferase family)